MSHLTAGGRTALILFGSETGNAQDIAGDVERMASRLRFSTRISSLDSIDVVWFARATRSYIGADPAPGYIGTF